MIAEKITFGEHEQEEFGLLPKQVIISPPEVKTYLVSVPGRSGSLDFTEALTDGQVVYNDRLLTITMYCFADEEQLPKMESACKNALHGKKMNIVMDCDPGYYYRGRLSVDWVSEDPIDIATITATCDPYKYKLAPTVKEFDVSGSEGLEIILQNDRMPTVPTVTTDAEITVEFGESTIVFAPGTRKAPALLLLEGANHMTLTGTGHIKFEYQEGAL